MVDKKFQVFISSTFRDLEASRREISQALLQVDCFPSGMELFPAADEEQFEYIKSVIRECDYVIVISAGMYGSLHPDTGLSYTEMEYDFAISIDKPVIRLLHRDPFSSLQGSDIESDAKKREKLEQFRDKLSKSRLVHYWSDQGELGRAVILGLLDIKKRKPAVGWVRGDSVIRPEVLREISELRQEVSSAKGKKENSFAGFDKLTGRSEVELKGVDDPLEDEEHVEDVMLRNGDIVEAVFIALLDNERVSDIAIKASDDMTKSYKFPESISGFHHKWLNLPHEVVRNSLHYLESNDLAIHSKSGIVPYWRHTSRGRKLAASFLAAKRFS